MSELKIIICPEFKIKLLSYPQHIRLKTQYLRDIVYKIVKKNS